MTMFKDEFSEEVWTSTYKYYEDTVVDSTFRRVAKSAAGVEKTDELKKEWEEKFFDLLSDFKFLPGGRITANAGTGWRGTTLLNCFSAVKPKKDLDSLEGILQVLKYQSLTLKSEGGWGCNFSFLRPRGSLIQGIGVETPGAVKYMELFDKSSDIITSGSGKEKKGGKKKDKIRKGAQIAILDCTHPDIFEFITAKQTQGRLTKFNMSINCSNEFMDKVIKIKETIISGKEVTEEMEKWDLIFPDTTHEKYKNEWDGNIQIWKNKGYPVKVHKTIKVSELWDLIIKSTYNRNEPGILFMDIANKTHPVNYLSDCFISTCNPCSEQILPDSANCLLGSINLTQFVNDKRTDFDYEKIKKYSQYAVRFLDNINDVTNTPLVEYKEFIKAKRRIGLGVMGWGSSLFMIKTKFASDQSEKIKDKLMKTIIYNSVEYSVELAKEKGMFPDCIPEKHADCYYFDQIELPSKIRESVRKHGIRNSAMFSCQPTGNGGVFANITSGGIEPVFLPEYIRTVIVTDVPDHIKDKCPKFWEGVITETEMFKMTKEGDDDILRGTDETGIVYKIDKNRGLTREVKCIDYGARYLMERGEWDPKAEWAVTTDTLTVDEHLRDLKGFTKWLDASASKTINLPNDYPFEKFENVYLDAYKTGYIKGVTTYRKDTMMSVLSSTDRKIDDVTKITKTNAPKRPKELKSDVHHVVQGGERYYVIVGFLGGDPFEVFTGPNNDGQGDVVIPKTIHNGIMIKKTRGKYVLKNDEKEWSCMVTNGHSDPNADALTRMISTSLRHGTDISFIVHQLEKTKGDLMCFAKVVSRSLKKYISDGTKVHGEECPECHSKNIIRVEGCFRCSQCSFSKCS